MKGNVIRAVGGVDLAVQAGETFAIVGESGSGKTTLANLILGVERPTGGEIFFRGAVLGRNMTKDTRRRIQVVQQNPISALNPKRTIRKSIELPLSVHRLRPPKQRRDREAMVVAYFVDGMRVGKSNNLAKVRNREAFLDDLPEGELAAGSTNTLVYTDAE